MVDYIADLFWKNKLKKNQPYANVDNITGRLYKS